MYKSTIQHHSLIISFLFLIQYNCIIHRLVVYKQAYDIGQEGSQSYMTPHQTTTS